MDIKHINNYVMNDIATNRNWSNQTAAPFSFYEAMNYPKPEDTNWFSRISKNEIMKEYLHFIDKWKWIFRHIPFISAVYLANSITFNALKNTSDIDILLITDPKRIWIARFLTTIVLGIFQIKRTARSAAKKFCLSFSLTTQAQNIQNLLLNKHDLYLPYRVAHLVPLYQRNTKQKSDFFLHNSRVKDFLPDRTPKQHIHLGIIPEQGRSHIKRFLENIGKQTFGDILEKSIIKIWTPWIRKKINKNPDLHQGVIFNEKMLKFHHDKRAEYSKKIFHWE